MSFPSNPARDILLGDRPLNLPTTYEELTVYTKNDKGKREDVHRPSAINPGDYEFVKVGQKRKAAVQGKLGGPAGTCHHCGKAIVWEVYYKHVPSDVVVTFGYQCADILDMTDNRIDHEMNLLKRRAANERREEAWAKQTEDRRYEFKTKHADLYTFLMEFEEDNSYISSIKWGIEKYGSPTDAQIDGLRRFKAGREKFAAKKVEQLIKLGGAPELEAGRYVIEGTIRSHKYTDSPFGTQHKMTVEMDNGNRVYGTVPSNIENDVDTGVKVKFTATVAVKDEHFGYFARPAKAQIV